MIVHSRCIRWTLRGDNNSETTEQFKNVNKDDIVRHGLQCLKLLDNSTIN